MLLNWILASGSWSKATYGSHKYLLSWPNVCLSRRIRQLIIRSGRFDPPVYGHKVRPGAVVFSQHGRKIIGFQINWFTNGNDGLGQTGVQPRLMTVFGRAALTPGRMDSKCLQWRIIISGNGQQFFRRSTGVVYFVVNFNASNVLETGPQIPFKYTRMCQTQVLKQILWVNLQPTVQRICTTSGAFSAWTMSKFKFGRLSSMFGFGQQGAI